MPMLEYKKQMDLAAQGRLYASTEDMAKLLGVGKTWLRGQIGKMFMEDLHTINLGHKMRRWNIALCWHRFENWTDNKIHNQFVEEYIALLSSPKYWLTRPR